MKNIDRNKFLAAGAVLSFFLFTFAFSAGALTLKDSVGIALKSNPSVLASQKKLEAANARLSQAVGAFFPTVQVNGSYTQAYTRPSALQVTIGPTTEIFITGTNDTNTIKSIGASASQPLFVAALWPGMKIAQRGVDVASEDLRRTVQSTSYNVAVAYYGLLSADKFVKVSADSLAQAESHRDQVEALLRNGVATRADLLRAEVQVANSEVALTKAKNGDELAKDSFNNVLGRDIDTPVDLTEDLSEKAPALPDYQMLLTAAFANRPDWKQFIYGKQVAAENLSVAQTGYLPTLMLNGKIGDQIIDYTGYHSDVNSWSVTGAASWTLFDGLGLQNRIREASANLDAQTATEEQVKDAIALEVRGAYLDLKTGVETIDSSKKAVDFADESYKVSSLRFNSGVGTNLEVIDAQVALTQAKTNYLSALFNLEVAKAKINNVVGQEVF
jgi:outer membrane protein